MEKKPPYDNTSFYTGYEENEQEFPTADDTDNLNTVIHTNEIKEIITLILLAVPMFILFVTIFWCIVTRSTPFASLFDKLICFSGGMAGILLSWFIVRKLSNTDKKRELSVKHMIHFITMSVSCGTAMLIFEPNEELDRNVFDSYRSPTTLVLLIIALLMTIWGFFLYTKFEKKIFLPLMCIALFLSTEIFSLSGFDPRYDVSYSVDYYFVSSEEIAPKEQKAGYYQIKNPKYEELQTNVGIDFYVLSSCEEVSYYITNRPKDDMIIEFNFDEDTEKVLKEIFGENTPYDSDFFHDNYLVIHCMNYADTPEKVNISRVFVYGSAMKIKSDIYYKPHTFMNGRNEYCLAFIKIPKTYNIKHLSHILEKMEYH